MSAGRIYSLPITSLTSLTTTPFAQISTPATVPVEILRITLGQEALEASEQLALTICRRSTASTLPTATTPIPLNQRDPASLLTGSTTTNATGVATVTGTIGDIIKQPTFNALNGFDWVPLQEERPTIQPSSFLTMNFKASPSAGTWSGEIVFRELC